MPGTTSTALPSFSHDQHHGTDAAKRKGGGVNYELFGCCGFKRHHKFVNDICISEEILELWGMWVGARASCSLHGLASIIRILN